MNTIKTDLIHLRETGKNYWYRLESPSSLFERINNHGRISIYVGDKEEIISQRLDINSNGKFNYDFQEDAVRLVEYVFTCIKELKFSEGSPVPEYPKAISDINYFRQILDCAMEIKGLDADGSILFSTRNFSENYDFERKRLYSLPHPNDNLCDYRYESLIITRKDELIIQAYRLHHASAKTVKVKINGAYLFFSHVLAWVFSRQLYLNCFDLFFSKTRDVFYEKNGVIIFDSITG